MYSKLFDRHTTMRTDANWLFFNIEGLSSDPRLETAMSMLIAQSMSERSSGRSGQASITVLDECWALLDSPVLADCVVQLFRTARKRGASVWGISQTLEDFVGTKQKPKEHGAGILRNTSVKVIGQQPGDVSPLVDHLASERSRAERDQALLGATQGKKRRDSACPRRKVRDDANRAARADRSGLLGGDNVSAGAGVPCLVSQGKRRAATDRSLQRTRRAVPAWPRGPGSRCRKRCPGSCKERVRSEAK